MFLCSWKKWTLDFWNQTGISWTLPIFHVLKVFFLFLCFRLFGLTFHQFLPGKPTIRHPFFPSTNDLMWPSQHNSCYFPVYCLVAIIQVSAASIVPYMSQTTRILSSLIIRTFWADFLTKSVIEFGSCPPKALPKKRGQRFCPSRTLNPGRIIWPKVWLFDLQFGHLNAVPRCQGWQDLLSTSINLQIYCNL